MKADANRILRDEGLTPYQRWVELAAIENAARWKHDGRTFHAMGGGSDKKTGDVEEITIAILRDLARKPCATDELGELHGITTKSANNRTTSLQNRGWIKQAGTVARKSTHGGRRVNVWAITPAGREWLEGVTDDQD
jgi:DNA-binding MarR family transcriptional regulator